MELETRCKSCGSGALEWSRIRCHGKATRWIAILLITLSVLAVVEYCLVVRSEESIRVRAAIPRTLVEQRLRQSSTPEDIVASVLAGNSVPQERLRVLNDEQAQVVAASQLVIRAKKLTPGEIDAVKSVSLFLAGGGALISWLLLRKKLVWHCASCGDASFLHPGR